MDDNIRELNEGEETAAHPGLVLGGIAIFLIVSWYVIIRFADWVWHAIPK